MTFMSELPEQAVRLIWHLTSWLRQPEVACVQYRVILDPRCVHMHVCIDDGLHPTLLFYELQPFLCLGNNIGGVNLHIEYRRQITFLKFHMGKEQFCLHPTRHSVCKKMIGPTRNTQPFSLIVVPQIEGVHKGITLGYPDEGELNGPLIARCRYSATDASVLVTRQ